MSLIVLARTLWTAAFGLTVAIGMPAEFGLPAELALPVECGIPSVAAVPETGDNAEKAERTNRGAVHIEIDPLKNKLSLYKNGQLHKTYLIALGKPETPTPVGEWIVTTKQKNWGKWFGTRWIGLNVPWGIYGIHGTNRPHSIGHDLSHGCIRMLNHQVEELYDLIEVGTKVIIFGHVLGEPHQEPRRLAEGDAGGDVQLIQSRLRSGGYYSGPVDGRFGPGTTRALKTFERAHGLPVDGVVGNPEYIALGLLE